MSVAWFSVWEKYIWNWSKIIGLFHFFHYLFYQNVNQEHNVLSGCACGAFTYVCCENCMSGFSAFVLDLSKSGNILLRSANRNAYELRVMAAVK